MNAQLEADLRLCNVQVPYLAPLNDDITIERGHLLRNSRMNVLFLQEKKNNRILDVIFLILTSTATDCVLFTLRVGASREPKAVRLLLRTNYKERQNIYASNIKIVFWPKKKKKRVEVVL